MVQQTVDLLITTYNRPDALECVLNSVMNQVVLPNQVIIADDGSGVETKALIEKYESFFPTKLIHSWHEDNGFRAAESRNLALSKVKSDYVIIIDGDMLLEENFVHDHLRFSKPGTFLQGGRILLTKEKTQDILTSPQLKVEISIFDSKIESRIEKRLTSFRSLFLGRIFHKELKNKSKIRSCNMSFYFSDVKKVNGFNNNMVGWGREDSEFVERLINSGVEGRVLKFVALGYHLYHPEESKASLQINDEILNKTIREKLAFTADGLSKFI